MTEQTENVQTEQTETQQSFDLTIQDLNAVKSIIDIAAQRGSFKANEMAAVGAVYNKLVGFLESVSKQAQPSTTEQPTQG